MHLSVHVHTLSLDISLFQIVLELLHVMDDDANPRVQTHGAAALVNFTEECPKTILLLYIDAIMDKLEKVLSNKMKEVG